MPLITNYRKTRGIIQRGVRADQPAATDVLPGTLYCVTDEAVAERSTGSAWETFPFAEGQIKFPATQNASGDVNTLDDYEEGSWTPALSGSGGASGQAYTIQVGRYIKIGKKVSVWCRIQLSTLGTVTGGAIITGLPFTSANYYQAGQVGYWSDMTSTFVNFSAFVDPSATTISFFGATAATATITGVAQANLSNISQLIIAANYEASA